MGSAASAAMLCLLFFFLLGCSSAQNNIGDPCTNECEPGNPLAWCGERRFDPAGHVVRCVQGTKFGMECVDSCSAKNESYFWCWTNAQNDVSDYWEKCGTSKGVQRQRPRPLQLGLLFTSWAGAACAIHNAWARL